MTTAAAYGRAALAVLQRDFLIFTSYRIQIIAQLVAVVMPVALFFYVSRLVNTPQFPTPEDYFTFALIGLVVLRGLTLSFMRLSLSVRQELVAGTFERMATSPFGGTAGAVGMTLFPFALSVFLGAAVIAFAATIFGVSLAWSTLPLALPVLLLYLLAVAPFSILIAAAVIAFKQAASAARFFVIGIAVTAGFLFPVSLLPGWLRWTSEVQPFTPLVDLLRHVLVGAPLADPASTLVLKVLAFAAVLLPLSIYVLHASIQMTRRRATLIEY